MGFSLSTKPFEYIPEWNGNRSDPKPIKVLLKPLSLGDFWDLVRLGQKASKVIGEDFMKAQPGEVTELMDCYKPYLEKYVLKIEEVYEDGNLIDVKKLAERVEFTALLMEIVAYLVGHGQVTDIDKKKLETPLSLETEVMKSQDGSNSTVSVTHGFHAGNQ